MLLVLDLSVCLGDSVSVLNAAFGRKLPGPIQGTSPTRALLGRYLRTPPILERYRPPAKCSDGRAAGR
jgi:hypothetical protein